MFYKIVVILVKIIFFPFFRIRVHGLENLPKDNGIIICANHWSNFDPFFLAISLPKKFNFMAKKELFEIPILRNLLKFAGVFPVNRQGNDMKALRHAISLICEDKTLGIFPEGTRVKSPSRDSLKEGVGFIALKAKADIVPIEIISNYRLFSKTDIYVKEKIEIHKFLNLKNKEAMNKISDIIYKDIYEYRLERLEDGSNNI